MAKPVTDIGAKLRDLSAVTTSLSYPDTRPKYYMNILVTEYSRTGILVQGRLNPIGNIVLPQPSNLTDTHNVAYEQKSVNTLLGAGINSYLNSYGQSRPSTNNDGDKINVSKGAALLTPSALGASTLAQSLTGYVPNEFMTVLLKGPEYKRHEFQWRFSPKTPTEAKTLQQLILKMNNYVSPGLALFGALFTFPKVFWLAIQPNPQYMYKFKPCVCEAFVANYTPANQPAFHRSHSTTDGKNAPEGVDIGMRFLELEYWLENDFKDNNDPFDVMDINDSGIPLNDLLKKVTGGDTPVDPNSP